MIVVFTTTSAPFCNSSTASFPHFTSRPTRPTSCPRPSFSGATAAFSMHDACDHLMSNLFIVLDSVFTPGFVNMGSIDSMTFLLPQYNYSFPVVSPMVGLLTWPIFLQFHLIKLETFSLGRCSLFLFLACISSVGFWMAICHNCLVT